MVFRSLLIIDPDGPHDGQTADLRLSGHTITDIAPELTPQADEEVITLTDACVTPGFLDLGAWLGDPGHEEREDLDSLRAAAASGGYTRVVVLPESEPVRQHVTDLAYLLRQNGQHPVDILPAAALSTDLAGKDLTGMLELHDAGALVFTDGPARHLSGSLLKRALEYARVKASRVMFTPHDGSLAPEGQLHEGAVSTRLGLRGIPRMCETIPLRQALELLAYTESQLIVHLLSSAAGVAEIRRAKAAGLRVYATVSAHHLSFTVRELEHFDPNFKMLPPLREEADRQALIEGLLDGTIDAIVSNHNARHQEEKELEFPYAAFGALGLPTAFQQTVAALSDRLTIGEITRRFHQGPARILGLPLPSIQQGSTSGLTIFRTTGSAPFTADYLKGKTSNSPLLGRDLPGKILGVVQHGQYLAV